MQYLPTNNVRFYSISVLGLESSVKNGNVCSLYILNNLAVADNGTNNTMRVNDSSYWLGRFPIIYSDVNIGGKYSV